MLLLTNQSSVYHCEATLPINSYEGYNKEYVSHRALEEIQKCNIKFLNLYTFLRVSGYGDNVWASYGGPSDGPVQTDSFIPKIIPPANVYSTSASDSEDNSRFVTSYNQALAQNMFSLI